jgi:ATP-dependent Clp protease adaptor protein ClpS
MTQTLDPPTIPLDDLDTIFALDDLWAVIVWNDDVNTFQHVIKALIEILHHTVERAEALTAQVHNTGKAMVAARPKDEAFAAVQAFHRRGIQATMDQL